MPCPPKSNARGHKHTQTRARTLGRWSQTGFRGGARVRRGPQEEDKKKGESSWIGVQSEIEVNFGCL